MNGNGILSRPPDFDFPAVGVYDCWVKWNISDTERGIPPLRLLQAKDFSFIDSREKTGDDCHGHTGKFNRQRRNSSKTFLDLKFYANTSRIKRQRQEWMSMIGVIRMCGGFTK